MRNATVAKQFTFHAAHRLPNHDGLCKGEHGHSYMLEVAVTGRVNQPTTPVAPEDHDPDEGMVIDFKNIKEIYKEYIESLVEHKDLNVTMDGLVPQTWDVDRGERVPLTTCENIAMWIWRVYDRILVKEYEAVDFVRVTLWETPTSFARVPADRNGVDHV